VFLPGKVRNIKGFPIVFVVFPIACMHHSARRARARWTGPGSSTIYSAGFP
jgi:hypothetical protein